MFFSKNKDKFEVIDSGLRQLELKQKLLVEENESLRLENLRLKDEVDMLSKELTNYQNKEGATKIIDLFDKEQSTKSNLVSKIDEYLRAIDGCINLLEKQS